MNALQNYVNTYRNTEFGDEVPVDLETYFDVVEEFGVLIKAKDPRAIQACVYAEDQVGHDPEHEHEHSHTETSEIMSMALLAYAGSIEEGLEAGKASEA